jgi:hypothetical protein
VGLTQRDIGKSLNPVFRQSPKLRNHIVQGADKASVSAPLLTKLVRAASKSDSW